MEKLKVNLDENSYNILFSDNFDGLGEALGDIDAPKKLLIVTDTNVAPLYAEQVKSILDENGYDTAVHIFEAGEKNKNMNSILGICQACIDHKMDRKSMIIALGGGVVGDMAGFAAAIYMRGIRFVQVPTTLLSQSDSSVGGKTGVDFAESKNILGAFHQPKLVYINVSTLKTLPEEEFVSGMGEVVKHGVIYDSKFFEYLKDNYKKIKRLDEETLINMAKKNCSIKADVVMQDEKESGLRAILNFGHTIGHAAEGAFNFTMTHGACVGLGMCAASYIAFRRSMLSGNELHEIENVNKIYKLPIRAKIENVDRLLELMQNDKKKADGKLKFVLPTEIGKVVIVDDVTAEEIDSAIEYINK